MRELSNAWHTRHRGERPNTSFPFANNGASAGASRGRCTTCTASVTDASAKALNRTTNHVDRIVRVAVLVSRATQ